MAEKFRSTFGKIPVFGMIHLAGKDPVSRALEEISIYDEGGVDGAIVENYHGNVEDVITTLAKAQEMKKELKIGINILPNEFDLSFLLATCYDAQFIQLDYVAGRYTRGELDYNKYITARNNHPNILVLGGVWPKYYKPVIGSNLKSDLNEGVLRSDAIVVTGEGTGKETPLEKINLFRNYLGTHSLIVGAGVTAENAHEQLKNADGAIIGSYFKKNGKTENALEREKIRGLMEKVKELRK